MRSMDGDPNSAGIFTLPDGTELGLTASRFDERQRRLRLHLAASAACWDYAPLIDVVRREPGFQRYRFTGKSAAQWLADLRAHRSPECDRFRQWYESMVSRHAAAFAARPRIPDNHYCIELATPPWVSSLALRLGQTGPERAPVSQWLGTLRALVGKGIKAEELEASGVITRLECFPREAKLSRGHVLRMIDLTAVTPRLVGEARFGFVSAAGWRELCRRIPDREFRRRGLRGSAAYRDRYLIRFRHRSLAWAIVRARHSDLFTVSRDWWCVLNEKGQFVAKQPWHGFATPEQAMEFAESRLSERFAHWGKDRVLTRWERYALPGGDGYRELLVQLDDVPADYRPRHYRTRNVLVHVRTSVRRTQDGRRVLFLDEVQSDWHADLHAAAKGKLRGGKAPVPDAPYRKEWPLLAMKLMLWWAQRTGVDGLAWSTAELQHARWGDHGPPAILYRTILPEAATALAATLACKLEPARLAVRSNRHRVELSGNGWEVRNRADVPVTKAFRTRAQAERFADLIGEFSHIEVPVLWIGGLAPIRSIPIYGTGLADDWLYSQ